MEFHKNYYRLFLLLGNPAVIPVWDYSMWETVNSHFGKLLVSKRGHVDTRVTQIDKATKKYVSFGKLGWNQKSHDKWIHNSPVTKSICRDWCFESAETWMPSMSMCEKEDKSPDVFFQIINEKMGRAYFEEPVVNPIIMIAISNSVYIESMEHEIIQIKGKLDARLFIIKNRLWGFDADNSFTSSINDLILTSLFVSGKVHDGGKIEEKFQEEWDKL